MSTQLNNPIPQADGTYQAITGLRFNIPMHLDQGQVKIDRDNISLTYQVVTYTDNLEEVASASRRVSFPNWPQAFRNDMRDVYDAIRQDARANGLLDPGTDEPLDQ